TDFGWLRSRHRDRVHHQPGERTGVQQHRTDPDHRNGAVLATAGTVLPRRYYRWSMPGVADDRQYSLRKCRERRIGKLASVVSRRLPVAIDRGWQRWQLCTTFVSGELFGTIGRGKIIHRRGVPSERLFCIKR